MGSGIGQHLSRSRLDQVRDVWFGHLQGPDSLVLPSQQDSRRWFMDRELDDVCSQRFGPTLEAIRESGLASGTELIEAVGPREADDWLSLVILLDQMPRNCYRDDAGVAFRVFDPLARDVALAAMERGIPEEPQLRWQLARRHWFYLPLMHSEDAALHRLATQAYEQIRADVDALADGDGAAPGQAADEFRARAAEVMRARPDEARKLGDTYLDFEKRHSAIIERFGRYPHRNAALGRESTAEETAYLAAGGETFGQK